MEELKTSSEWYNNDFGVLIMDHDGWDRSNLDYFFNVEKVTFNEYQKRKSQSTVVIMEG